MMKTMAAVLALLPALAAAQQDTTLARASEQAKALNIRGVGLMMRQNGLRDGLASSRDAVRAYGLAPKIGIQCFPDTTITALQKNGPAARAGIELGDKIVRVDGQDVSSLAEAADLISKSERVTLTVRREGRAAPLSFLVEKAVGGLPAERLERFDERYGALIADVEELGRRMAGEMGTDETAMRECADRLAALKAEWDVLEREAYAALGYEFRD